MQIKHRTGRFSGAKITQVVIWFLCSALGASLTMAIITWGQVTPFMAAATTMIAIGLLLSWRLISWRMSIMMKMRQIKEQRIQKSIKDSDRLRITNLSLPMETREERAKRHQEIRKSMKREK